MNCEKEQALQLFKKVVNNYTEEEYELYSKLFCLKECENKNCKEKIE